ncbi:MAG TPA: D-2-hydroxyacid dehydrogenase [Candidatus Dormibacteraeota bacterium]|nr:D-2-hydroxyacid dehydrogenase [Candidatus Dormibacteraeota bacterium]
MNVLILLAFPEPIRNVYRDGLARAFPQLKIDVVDHHSRVDPYISEANILVTFGAHLTDRVLEKASKLEWIQALGTGVDGIVDSPALRDGVIVTNLRGLHGASVSESVLAAMLALSRNLPRAVRSQDAGRWDRFPVNLVKGKTVGILGVGVIASELAPRCQALGMKVIGITSSPRSVPGFDRVVSRDELLDVTSELDHLVLLIPYTSETDGIVGRSVLQRMKRSAFLINVARGGVVDQAALVEALRSGLIAGAALDVFVEEPLPDGHPLWKMPNVLVTPHMAGFHAGYPDEALPIVIENIRHFLAGDLEGMTNVVRR